MPVTGGSEPSSPPRRATDSARMAVTQAALASVVSARLGMDLAPTSGQVPAVDERGSLSLVGGGSHDFGYPFVNELFILEARSVHGEPSLSEPPGEGAGGISTEDELFAEMTAFVYDSLLNPVLPFADRVPTIGTTATIADVYGKAVRDAEYAGRDVPQSSAWRAARDLLYVVEGTGVLEHSAVLTRYHEFEELVAEEATKLSLMEIGSDNEAAERSRTKLRHLKAEWDAIGRRPEVEEAFRVMEVEQRDANFMEERRMLIKRFEGGAHHRIDAPGVTFHTASLAPLGPLLDESTPDGATGWQRVSLDVDDVEELLTPEIRARFALDSDHVDAVLARLVGLTYNQTVAAIVRQWLDPSFFRERYWRLRRNDMLSDGAGGGDLPTLPEQMVFIRGVEVTHREGLEVVSGKDATPAAPSRRRIAASAASPEPPKLLVERAGRAKLTRALKVVQSERVKAERSMVVLDSSSNAVFFRAPLMAAHMAAATPMLRQPSSLPRDEATLGMVAMSTAKRSGVRPASVAPRRREGAKSVRVRDHRGPRMTIAGVVVAHEVIARAHLDHVDVVVEGAGEAIPVPLTPTKTGKRKFSLTLNPSEVSAARSALGVAEQRPGLGARRGSCRRGDDAH